MALTSIFHFDAITIIVMVAGFLGTWYTLRADSKWHTDWIKRHDEESLEREKTTTKILTALEVANARLTTLTESNCERIGRLEEQMDRKR